MLFDPSGVIKKYSTPEAILQEFFDLRITYYLKRKAMLLKVCGWQRGWAGEGQRGTGMQDLMSQKCQTFL